MVDEFQIFLLRFLFVHLQEFKNALPSHTLLLWTHTHFKLTKKLKTISVVSSDRNDGATLTTKSLAFTIIITSNNTQVVSTNTLVCGDGKHNVPQYGVRVWFARKATKTKILKSTWSCVDSKLINILHVVPQHNKLYYKHQKAHSCCQ